MCVSLFRVVSLGFRGCFVSFYGFSWVLWVWTVLVDLWWNAGGFRLFLWNRWFSAAAAAAGIVTAATVASAAGVFALPSVGLPRICC